MPVGIVQVVNNTSHTLTYTNGESGRTITVSTQTEQYENNGWMPSSAFKDDTVPFYSSGYSIEIKLDDFTPMKISDYDWKFSIVGPSGPSGEVTQDYYGDLVNGGQYVVRVDEIDGKPGSNRCGIMIYKYDDSIESVSGHVVSHVLQHAGVVVGLVLMSIFF